VIGGDIEFFRIKRNGPGRQKKKIKELQKIIDFRIFKALR
jgi:hypothetical protein